MENLLRTSLYGLIPVFFAGGLSLLIARIFWPRLPENLIPGGVVFLSLASMGASGRLDVDTLAAATVATAIRFLMPNRTPVRTVAAAFLASVSLAWWGIPLCASAFDWPDTSHPVAAFLGGLLSLNIMKFIMEDFWEILKTQARARLSAGLATPTPTPPHEDGE